MRKTVKTFILFAMAICIFCNMFAVNKVAAAYHGSSVLAFSSKTVKVGETVKVTATFSSTLDMEILQGALTYDTGVLEYVGANSSNCNEITKGRVKIYTDNPNKSRTHTEVFTFKAVAVGTSKIALEQIYFWGMDEIERSIEGASGVSVKVINTSSEASSDANLRNIAISAGTLSPKFDPDVTSYSITISNEVTELFVQTTRHEKATVNIEGSANMKVGLNKRVIVVTAENGNTKSYTLNITRLAADGTADTTPPDETDEPLNDLSEVFVDGASMYVVEEFSTEGLPAGFEVIEYAFDGKTVPALSDDTYIILMLRLPDNSESGFYVYENDGSFVKLVTVTVGGLNYSVLPTSDIPVGYTATTDYEIGGVKVPAFKSDKEELAEFITVYAKGPGGVNGFYNYDTVDQTLQRAVGITLQSEIVEPDTEPEDKADLVNSFISLNTNGKIVVITILAIILLLLAAIVVLIVKIATSGKDDYDEDEEDEDLFEDEDDIVGFEYVSLQNPAEEPTAPEQSEDESETEEE